MVNSQNHKTRAAIAVICMLAASPLAVTFAQAEVTDGESDSEVSKSLKMTRSDKVKAILAERIVDGKLQVRQFDVAEDATPDEIRRTLMFEGKTTGWAYVSGKAYNSGIVLFDGKAIKIGERSWDLSSKGEMEVAGRTLDLELKGKAHGQRVILHGTATNDDLEYRIVLSGKVAQSGEDDIFAIAFIHAGLKNPEVGPNIKLLHLGEISVHSNHGDKPTIDSFKESVSVA